MSGVELSLVLPCYNEVEHLSDAVSDYLMELGEFFDCNGFELIIVEGGCVDGTTEKSRFLSNKFDSVRHLHFDDRQGRGLAVTKGFELAEGDIYAYSDVDHGNRPDNLIKLVKRLDKEGELVVGSRVCPESDFERKRLRGFLSSYYNRLARLVLGSCVSDHQCGLKVFDSKVFDELVDDIGSRHWAWDTEILYKAQLEEFEVIEVPISGVENTDSTVKPIDPLIMSLNLVWLKLMS